MARSARRKGRRRGILSGMVAAFPGSKSTRRRGKRVTSARIGAMRRGLDPIAAADRTWRAMWGKR